MSAIALRDVTKRYGTDLALDDVSLTVERGEIYGFLGPNGAGKSTTINLLLDFIRPTSGTVEVFGMDARTESLAIRERTGVLPEGVDLYDRLTGRQHVAFAIESKAADDDPGALLERVGIPDAAGKKVGGYSKGMRQRLVLATALVGAPDLLILDEPSTGLDPAGAHDMREIIREERDRGATVFFSSHVLGQVEAVCDRVGILRNGRLVAEDTVEGLAASTASQTQLQITLDGVPEDGSEALRAIDALEGVSAVSAEGPVLTVACDDDAKIAVLRTVEEYGVRVENFAVDEPSLEDLFMAYTSGDGPASDSGPGGGRSAAQSDGSAADGAEVSR